MLTADGITDEGRQAEAQNPMIALFLDHIWIVSTLCKRFFVFKVLVGAV
jgi:hypothetical protein